MDTMDFDNDEKEVASGYQKIVALFLNDARHLSMQIWIPLKRELREKNKNVEYHFCINYQAWKRFFAVIFMQIFVNFFFTFFLSSFLFFWFNLLKVIICKIHWFRRERSKGTCAPLYYYIRLILNAICMFVLLLCNKECESAKKRRRF